MDRRRFLKNIVILGIGLSVIPINLNSMKIPKPTKKDRCPVCGMYVWRHQKNIAGFIFKDGKYVFFCSVKCMFHAYHNFKKYFPHRNINDLKLIWVTEYYTTKKMNAKNLYYVIGTDIIGPMGYMIVPVKGKKAAETLLRDHHGSKILTFDEVTEKIVEETRKGHRVK